MVITKELLEKTYYDILNERQWLSEIDYQKEWLTNPESYTHQNNVLAQCPAAGKSNTITIYLEIRFRLGLLVNPTLLFSAAETLLKLNMADTFKLFKPSFKYIVVNKPEDIIEGSNKCVNVYISLPQMFTEQNKKNSKLLPKIDLLITDEAHIWFQKKTIQNFIREQGIKQFVELTGSPYIFNLKNQIAKEKGRNIPYRMFYVTTSDLLDKGRISNVKIELITTPAYNFTHKSFVGSYGNLKSNLTSSKKRNRHLLESVLEGMLNKCNYNTDISFVKNKSNLGAISKLWHNIGNMFSDMGQTILTCDSIEMAEEFNKILLNNPETKDMVLISHSKNDPKSENFAKFEQNPKKYKLLIVVDRGQLGYNYLELFNIVDFTFSTNIIMIHQRLNRVTRKSKLNPDKEKIFFKVSTNELEGYYKVIMSAVLHLNQKYWYENFNTKNLGQLPLTLIRKRKSKKQSAGQSTNRKTKKVKFQNFDDLELLDIDLFKGVLHNADGAFETYAVTTIDDVRREFFNIQTPRHNGYKKHFISYDECSKWFEKNKITTQSKWRKWMQENKRPEYIPSNPEKQYKKSGEWNGWGQFTGSGNVLNGKLKYKTFKEARKIVRSFKFKSKSEYDNWCKSDKPKDIPTHADRCKQYENEWKGWEDYLGCEIIHTNDMKLSDYDKKKICNLYTKFLKQNKGNHKGICVKILDEFYNDDSISINQIRTCVRHLQPKVRQTPYTKSDIPELKAKLKNAKGMKEARGIIGTTAYNFLKELGIIKKLFPYRIVGNQFGLKVSK